MAHQDELNQQVQIVARCLQKLQEAPSIEEAPVQEVCTMLDRMPEVRQRIISEANSASGGIWRRIDDVHHATARLGVRRLEQILGKFVTSPTRVPPSPHFGHRATPSASASPSGANQQP